MLPKVASTPALASQVLASGQSYGGSAPSKIRPVSAVRDDPLLLEIKRPATVQHVIQSDAHSLTSSSQNFFRSSASSFRGTSKSSLSQSTAKLPPLPKQPISFEEFYAAAKRRAVHKSIEQRKMKPRPSKRKLVMPIVNPKNKVKEAPPQISRNLVNTAVHLPEADRNRLTSLEEQAATEEDPEQPTGKQDNEVKFDTSHTSFMSPSGPQTVWAGSKKSIFDSRASRAAPESGSPKISYARMTLRGPLNAFTVPFVPRERRDRATELGRWKSAYLRFAPSREAELHVDDVPEVLDYLGFLRMDAETVKGIVESYTRFATLSFEEFSDVVEKCCEVEQEMLKSQFEKFDVDYSGTLSYEELGPLIQSLGITPLRSTLEEALEVVDDDQSGEVDYEEFEHLMALYRVTEGFTRDEISALERVFERFSVTPIKSVDKILKAEHLGAALKHMFGPQATGMAKTLGTKSAQIMKGRSSMTAPGDPQDQKAHVGMKFNEFVIWARRLREMEIAEYRKYFDQFDLDRSGTIDVDELQQVIESIGYMPLRSVVEDALEEVDSDQNKSLDFDEFVELMVHWRTTDGFSRDDVDEFSNVFSVYDKDRTGEIECLQLMDMLRYLGHITNFKSLQRMVREVDYNNTSTIDFREFLRLMRIFREEELTGLKTAFKMYKNADGMVKGSSMKKVLSYLGYLLKDDDTRLLLCPKRLDFDDCAEFVEQIRRECMAPRRQVAGYSDEEILYFRKAFKAYDEDGNGKIERFELTNLLQDLKIPMATVADQKEMLVRIDNAREAARTAGLDSTLVGDMGDPDMTFDTLLHFLRHLHNEDDRKEVLAEAAVVEETRFTAHEVADFRATFEKMAGIGPDGPQPSMQEISTSNRETAMLARTLTGASADQADVVAAKEYLSDNSVQHVVTKLGLQMNMVQRAEFHSKLKSYHVYGRPGLDFPDFLRFMRWMLDTNFANINGNAAYES